jgi:hypothetical protein
MVASLAVSAQETEGWYPIGTSKNDNIEWSIKLGTIQRSENKAGERITIVVGKYVDKEAGRVHISKWYVTDTDCEREYGNLTALKMDGKFLAEAPFAKGSEDVASKIAETLCLFSIASGYR